MSATLPAGWVDQVLAFWFGELTPQAWFKPDPALDTICRDRFLDIHEALAANPPESTTMDARTALAAIIALDQFPRNMFRGTPRAFATDPQALAFARAGVDRGLDGGFTKDEKAFFYLPFEHSEDAAAQARSVRLFEATGDPEYAKYAIAHKVIIDRFGRFPHRNAILGRPSTPEEVEFLKQPGSGF
jgi:uncharacterized protein (DUF924 family)